jgi:Fic family protein
MDWIIKRSTDSRNDPAPREIIYFLNKAAEHQTARLELGEEEPDDEALFDRAVFKEALPELSEYRTTKMLYAEYSDQKKYIEKMRGEKAEQNITSLSDLWGVSEEEAKRVSQKLTEIGFFEQRGSRENLTFWVPFIYRPYLNLVQGKAESDQ